MQLVGGPKFSGKSSRTSPNGAVAEKRVEWILV